MTQDELVRAAEAFLAALLDGYGDGELGDWVSRGEPVPCLGMWPPSHMPPLSLRRERAA